MIRSLSDQSLAMPAQARLGEDLPDLSERSPVQRRLRVLAGAFALSPARGSESGLGWNICSRLAKYHDVHVLTCQGIGDENYRAEVDHYTSEHGEVPGLTLHYVHRPRLSQWLQQPHVSLAAPLYYVGYAAWQREALTVARRLHAEKPFDLAHQLTISTYREPGYLWKLGIPFVWGPIAGASNIPWPFFSMFGFRDRAFYGLKNLVNNIHKTTRLRSRRAAKAARKIFVVGADNRQLVADRWGYPCEVMLDSGCPAPVEMSARYDGTRPLKLVWSGLHIGRKALPILLSAVAKLKMYHVETTVELTVLGDGPLRQTWMELARALRVDQHVQWRGQLPREQALAAMREADLLAFTSLQEGTPNVVMEALSLGLPVICHRACGMGTAVDETCGITIPMRSPERSIADFAAEIRALSHEPARLARLSAGALRRADALSWDRKAAHIAGAYGRITPSPAGDHAAS